MAGVAGLEPVTSAVTGQRSNQLSYTPAKGNVKVKKTDARVKFCFSAFLRLTPRLSCARNFELNKIRAADAKEVGVGNPAEETCCYPNEAMLQSGNDLSTTEHTIKRKIRFSPVLYASMKNSKVCR